MTRINTPIHYKQPKQRAAGPYEVAQEHIEILVQFGYVSMFAVAFPLAPILAFLNNVRTQSRSVCYAYMSMRFPVFTLDTHCTPLPPFYQLWEARLDLLKLRVARRPAPRMVKHLGGWYTALEVRTIARVSVKEDGGMMVSVLLRLAPIQPAHACPFPHPLPIPSNDSSPARWPS